MFSMRMDRYIGITTSRVSALKLGRVFALYFPTADAVVTEEVNCYSSRPLTSTETISQGYCSAAQQPLSFCVLSSFCERVVKRVVLA